MDKKAMKKGKLVYSAVLLCTAVLILTGYIITNGIKIKNELKNQEVPVNPPAKTAVPTATPKPVSKPETSVPKTTKAPSNPKVVPSSAPITAENENVAVNAMSIEDIKLAMPVEGTITTAHSPDTLHYSVTFDDWRTHSGIDIDAEESAQVKAAADGKVKKVYTDELMGIVIELDHGEYTTVYSNLSTDKLVKEGDSVKKGDIISGIGKTAKAEALQNPHLHFEVFFKGISEDPAKFIKE